MWIADASPGPSSRRGILGRISPCVVEISPSSIAGSLLQPQPLSWDVMSECIDLVICCVDWMFVGWSRESSDSIVVSHVVLDASGADTPCGIGSGRFVGDCGAANHLSVSTRIPRVSQVYIGSHEDVYKVLAAEQAEISAKARPPS